MIRKFAKGNSKITKRIIKALEDLGGKNISIKKCDNDTLYIIDNNNNIIGVKKDTIFGQLIVENFKEILFLTNKDKAKGIKNKKTFIYTLKPCEEFLAQNPYSKVWEIRLFSCIFRNTVIDTNNRDYDNILPYNKDTMKYIGTTEDIPENFWNNLY